ncbi:hypothetical protein Bbelb_160810 [Branchiostoma belcheri]|nr:hypothetical protein Bbelb_160810 [Branchiostoma belcheri]
MLRTTSLSGDRLNIFRLLKEVKSAKLALSQSLKKVPVLEKKLSWNDKDVLYMFISPHCTGDCPPIKQRPHRTPLHRQAEIHRQVDTMLADDVIEPSQSPWASPVVLARKKDGSFRFCVDYRKLNQATVKDAHPLPRTDVVLDALAGSALFTTLDLTSGYWQVNIDPTAATSVSSVYLADKEARR